MNNGNEPAYPTAVVVLDGEDYLATGLTKRERFAMAAMQGYLGNEDIELGCKDLSVHSIAVADALLAELENSDDDGQQAPAHAQAPACAE